MSDPRVTLIGHPAPAWIVNYADLMTELVCFFIVLYAMSAALNKDVQKAKKEVEEAMKQEQVAGEVKVTKDGMQITIQEKGENVFFTSGSADLSPKMDEMLAKMAPSLLTLAKDGHEIIVEGHTDNVPIHTARFSSNWDLSTARATKVVQHMIKHLQFPPKAMGAIGYGENHPLMPNDSEENRAANRRVVFFVKNKPPDFDKAKPAKEKAKPKREETPAQDASEETSEVEAAEPAQEELPEEPTAESAIPLPREAVTSEN